MPDLRLAHTGLNVAGREVIDDQVLLADFERFLEFGEGWEQIPDEDVDTGGMQMIRAVGEAPDVIWELLGFIDRHGRQLLELAKRGAETSREKHA
jgi:hypothetical protein